MNMTHLQPAAESLHFLQVNVAQGGSCRIRGKEYSLLQWHFHTPSEHAFGGDRQAMELHVVHKDASTGVTFPQQMSSKKLNLAVGM